MKPKKNKQQGKNALVESIVLRQVEYINGVPRIIWTEEEVQRNLQLVVVGKFAYGWLELDDLTCQIPKKCKINIDCKIDLLKNSHILVV